MGFASYYDNTVNDSIICQKECLKDQTDDSRHLKNVDFCYINEMYLNYTSYISNKSLNAQYIHAMMWSSKTHFNDPRQSPMPTYFNKKHLIINYSFKNNLIKSLPRFCSMAHKTSRRLLCKLSYPVQ
jgi:hypothetical protein